MKRFKHLFIIVAVLLTGIGMVSVVQASEYAPQAFSIQQNAGSGTRRVIMLPVCDPDTQASNLICTVSTAFHGSVEFLYAGAYPTHSRWVAYTSTNGYTGTDRFTFQACDGVQTSGVATCTVVVAANTAPQARMTLAEAAGQCATGIELRGSDLETATKYLACTIITPPGYGTLEYGAPSAYPTNSYQLVYQATNSFTGTDTFSYQVSDGMLTSSVATGIVYVVSNTPPTANTGMGITAPGTPCRLWLNGWDDQTRWDELVFIVTSNPVHGSVRYLYPDAFPLHSESMVYQSTNGYIGEDRFGFAVSDGALTSAPSYVSITIQTNTPPDAQSSSNRMAVTSANLDLYLNGWDVETDQELLDFTVVQPPANGTVACRYPGRAPTGSYEVVYTLTNPVPTTDMFTFQVSDGDLVSGMATVLVTLVTNSAPTANDRSCSVVQGGVVDLYLSGTDAESVNDLVYIIVDPPDHGVVVYRYPDAFPDQSAQVSYYADPDYVGNDSFSFKVNDGALDSDPATVTVTVQGNTAPTASAMTLEATEGQTTSISLDVNDGETAAWELECIITVEPGHGQLSYQYPDTYPESSSSMEYTPDPGYSGPDQFVFKASDGSLDSGTATCSITVAVNNPPTANNMADTGVENTPLNILLDVEDAETSVYQLECVIVGPPSNGAVAYRYPGSYPSFSYQVQYTPSNGYSGPDSFTFNVSDGMYTSGTAVCSLFINTNTPPTARNLRAATITSASVSIIADYDDPDPGQIHTAVVVSAASDGEVLVSGTTLTYTPDDGFAGTDSFTYRINDGQDDSNVAAVDVQVRAPWDRASNLVAVLVRDTLLPEISNEVNRLQNDLVSEGYSTRLKLFSASASVSDVWTWLHTQYTNTSQWMDGAILIGSLPIPVLAGGHETDLVYWNMSTLQASNSVNTFDIWVSRIYSSGTTYGDEATLIRRALDVNHDYRTGRSRLPHDAYYYHAWSSYAAGDQYGAAFTNIWPNVLHTNEVGGDHQSNAKFFPERNINEAGADALVGGGEIFQETSHGNKTCYMNGRFRIEDVHRLGSQQRFIMGESCTSGDYGGIINQHILSRIGGTLFAVGGTEINYVGDFQLAEPYSAETRVRTRLAQGESWGKALLSSYPFSARNRTVYYGDLSTGVMAADSNSIPIITGLAVDNSNPRVGEAVTFTVTVSDPDAGGTDSPYYDFEHQADWWPLGYDNGKKDPVYTTNDNGTAWTNFTYTYTENGSFRVRVEVMDEWQARGWREITVVANDPAVAVADHAEVEAGHAVTIAVLTNDYDPNGDGFTIDTFSPGTHGSVTREEQSLVYTATNIAWTGTDTFTYAIEDDLSGSSTATVTVDVVVDAAGPSPMQLSNFGNMNRLVLLFDEPVEAGSGFNGAENPLNYTLNNAAGVVSAQLRADTRSVYLGVTGLLEYVEYVLTINNIRDRAATPNTIAADTQMLCPFTFRIADDNFESGNGDGGCGWLQAWELIADADMDTGVSPRQGSYHLRLRSAGMASREVDMTGVTDAVLQFWWKAYSLDSGESAVVDVYDGTWHTLLTVNDGEDDNAYHFTNFNLNTYTMVSNFTVRAVIFANQTYDFFFIDEIEINYAGSGAPEDGDSDGMADNWEIVCFGSTEVSDGTPDDDQDGDGSCDSDEYRAGTDPDDASSYLAFEHNSRPDGPNLVLTWHSAAGRQYMITAFTSLLNSAGSVLQSDIAATPPVNTHTSAIDHAAGRFFRIELQ